MAYLNGAIPSLAEDWQETHRRSRERVAAGDDAGAAVLTDHAVQQAMKELGSSDARLQQLINDAGTAYAKSGDRERAAYFYRLLLTIWQSFPPASQATMGDVEIRLKALADGHDTIAGPTGATGAKQTVATGESVQPLFVDTITGTDNEREVEEAVLSGEVMVLTPMDPGQAEAMMKLEDQAAEQKPIILDKKETSALNDPCQGKAVKTDSAATDPAQQSAVLPAGITSSLGMNINKLTGTFWAGEVSAAREAMRLLAGPLSPEQEVDFNRMWAPLFDYPSDRAVTWLRTLNPLLIEFQAVEARVETLLEAVEEADYEAEMAAAYDNEIETAMALDRSKAIVMELTRARDRMHVLRRQIEAMGDPPDVGEEKCQARTRAREAVKDLSVPAKKSGKKLPLQAGPVCKGADALPPEFYKRIPPSYRGIFEARCIMSWLKGDEGEPAPQYQLSVNGWLPGKYPGLNLDFDTITVNAFRKKVRWQESSFGLETEDKNYRGYSCPESDPGAAYPQRFEISGTIAGDGRQLERLEIERSRLDCVCAKWGDCDPGYRKDDPDCPRACEGWRVDKRDFSYTFNDLPLVKAVPYINGAGPLGLDLQFEISGEDTARHISRYSPGSLSQKPLPSNNIKVSISAVHGAKEQAAPPDPLQEKVAFHENNIKWLRADLANLDRMLNQASDEASRVAIQYRITCKRSDLQAEQDAITTLQTGQFTRTPTAWDAMVRGQMMAQGRRMADQIKKAETNRNRMERMIAALPADERYDMRRFVERQLGDDPLDLEKQIEIGRVVSQRVQARALQAQAKADEDTARSQLAMDVCENYQQAAVYAMYATPFVSGGSALALVYGITSGGVAGYDQGGVKGAAIGATTTALRYWSPKIDYLITAYEGYQEGGAYGAAEKVAITFVKRKATQKAVQGVQGYQARAQAARSQAKLAGWRDAQRRVNFRQEREYGRAMVERHQEVYQQLRTAKQSGAPATRLNELRQQLMDQTAAIKHAPHAKGFLKLSATPAQQRAYNASDRLHARQTVNELRRDLEQQGFDPNSLNFRPMRNAGNSTPGMDLDLAMTSSSGNFVMRRNPDTGQTERLSLYEANALVQDRFNLVYARSSGGRSAEASWQQVTTGAHKEAYRDCNWLRVRQMHADGVDPRSSLDPGYAEQAASVTQFKADHMRKFQGMGKDNQNWEIYRGTRKDIDTKIRPLLERRVMETSDPLKKSQATAKLRFYMSLSNAMSKADHDPVAADREIRKLTGLDTLDIVNMVGGGLEALGKWQ